MNAGNKARPKQWQQPAEAKHLALMAAASSNSSPLTLSLWKTAPNWFLIVATSVFHPSQGTPFILWRLTTFVGKRMTLKRHHFI